MPAAFVFAFQPAFYNHQPKVFADYAGAEAEDRYQERLTLTAGLQDDDELFRLTWDYSTGKDGTLRHEGSFAVPGDQISVGFTADGALTRDGETVSVDQIGRAHV